MDPFSDFLATRKVRRFRVPAEARPDHDEVRTARVMRIFAGIAVFTLMMVVVLIAEPWETLRPYFMRP
jgi:hypothetical protein